MLPSSFPTLHEGLPSDPQRWQSDNQTITPSTTPTTPAVDNPLEPEGALLVAETDADEEASGDNGYEVGDPDEVRGSTSVASVDVFGGWVVPREFSEVVVVVEDAML